MANKGAVVRPASHTAWQATVAGTIASVIVNNDKIFEFVTDFGVSSDKTVALVMLTAAIGTALSMVKNWPWLRDRFAVQPKKESTSTSAARRPDWDRMTHVEGSIEKLYAIVEKQNASIMALQQSFTTIENSLLAIESSLTALNSSRPGINT